MSCTRMGTVVLLLLCSLTLMAQEVSAPLSTVQFNRKTIAGTPGFFRVGQSVNGRWWLIDPDGKPFFYRGVTSINRAGTQGGRRAVPGKYAAAVDARYGYPQSPDAFVEATLARLRGWGFNALGAWATPEFFDRGMPYTEILEFWYVGPFISQRRGSAMGTPDVFDPAWAAAIDEKARAICTPRRDSKLLVGYFTDNEIGFGELRNTDRSVVYKTATRPKMAASLLQRCLSLEDGRPAERAAWDFVLRRHQHSFARLSAAWGVPLASKADVVALTQARTAIVSAGYEEDDTAFARLFAERYFRMAAQAIRKYDPNHLILGCRWGGPQSVEIMAAQAPWVDIVSANNYQDDMYGRLDIYARATHKPLLVGEFAWASGHFTEVPLVGEPAGTPLAERVTKKGTLALTRAFTHPAIVGYTWYRWVQDGQPFSYGLVDTQDVPHRFNVELLTQLNARAEEMARRADRQTPAPADLSHATVSLTLAKATRREDATAVRYDNVTLALHTDDGVWRLQWPGTPVGTVTRATRDQRGIHLAVALRWPAGPKGEPAREAGYTIDLRLDGANLVGTYRGNYAGQTVTGEARGYAW